MIKLTAEQAQAVTNLRASSDFRVLTDMFKSMADNEMLKSLVQTETLQIGRSQGRSLILLELIKTINDAPASLEKLKPQ